MFLRYYKKIIINKIKSFLIKLIMSIPIKGYYNADELHKYFDSILRRSLTERGITTFGKYFSQLIESIDENIALQVLYEIFGDPVNDAEKYQSNSSNLQRFILGNYLNVKDFLIWYRTGANPNPEYTDSVKRFLLLGLLYIDIQTDDLLSYKSNKLTKYRKYDDILFIDGDNLYLHITPLFRISDMSLYGMIFFKKDNISNIFASFYRNNKERYDVIEAYGFKKDAADVDLTTLCTYIRDKYIGDNEDMLDPKIKRFYVVTGDEYADELVNLSNRDIAINMHTVNKLFYRLNAQPILYSKNRLSWSLDLRSIDHKIFGEILPAEYKDRPKIDWTIINDVFNNRVRFNYDMMCSPWMIQLLKTTGKHVLYQEYDDITKILLDEYIINFYTFINKVNSITSNQEIRNDLIEKYFVLIGAKFFTKIELRRLFLTPHYDYLTKNVYPRIEGQDFYTLNQFEMSDLINMKPSSPDALYYFYNYLNPSDLFVTTLDIPLSLGVINMTFGEQGDISTITIKKV